MIYFWKNSHIKLLASNLKRTIVWNIWDSAKFDIYPVSMAVDKYE